MSNKKTMLAAAALILLMMGYLLFLQVYIYPKHPEWAQTQPSSNSFISSESPPATALSPATTQAIGTPNMINGYHAVATTESSTPLVTLGSDHPNDGTYDLGLRINPMGAAIDVATLNRFKATGGQQLYSYEQPYAAHPDQPALGSSVITVNGQAVNVGNIAWNLEASSESSATFGVDILSGDTKIVHVTKTFQLPAVPTSHFNNTNGGYEVKVTYHVQNLSAALATVSLAFDGPTMPSREIERTDDRQIVTGYDSGGDDVNKTSTSLGDFKPETADKDLTRDSHGYRLLWAGTSSNYFAAIVQTDKPGQIASLHAVALNPNDNAPDRIVVLHFQTTDLSVPTGGGVDVPFSTFLGPKDRTMLEGDYYSSYPRLYSKLLITTGGLCGMCLSQSVVDILVDLLRAFHFVLRDWGLAIIALVIVVRVILHPITKKSQISMMGMQKMGPEMERLRKKFGDDKDALAKAQMEMYKEMGVGPFLGCLPMFLQTPIWIALYSALQYELSLRQAPFLWGFTWIHDLSRPDRLITWDNHAFTLPLLGPIVSFNLLPILMGIMMFVNQRMMRTPAATPEQAQQQKMMNWMSLVFSLFLYTYPSGLCLYILTSTTLGIIESKIIRKHIKEREEAEKSRVIVDAKPTRQAKQNRRGEEDKQKKKKGWFQRLQERAELLRGEMDRKKKKDES